MRAYVSAFTNWDARAWIRSKPHHAQQGFEPGLDFFPASVAVSSHLADCGAAPSAEIRGVLLVHELYAYLSLTTNLELGLVSSVCQQLLGGDSPVEGLHAGVRRDLLRTFADEAGHAEMCEDLIDAVERLTGTTRLPLQWPHTILQRLGALGCGCDPELRELVSLLAAVTAETLLSPVIIKLPTDASVQPPVRELVKDHTADEVRHAALFRVVFRQLWYELSPLLRRSAVGLLPDIVDALVRPDETFFRCLLAEYADVFSDPAQLAGELAERQTDSVMEGEAMGPLIALLGDVDALDDSEIADSLTTRGLLSGR